MQGQRSATGSLPDPINFDFGSTPSNEVCWNNLRDPSESRLTDFRIAPSGADSYVDTISQEAQNLSRWSIGESSYGNSQNLISHDERTTPNGWTPSTTTYEPSMVTSRNVVNLNLNINQIPSGPSSRPGGLEHNLFPSSSGSEAFASSSSGFLVEEDDGRSGCGLDGRSRLSCKRKTIEGNVGQSSNSGSFFSREVSMWQAVPPCYNAGSSNLNISRQLETSAGVSIPDSVNSRLELSMLGFAPDTLHTSSAESSQRSYRLRMNSSNHPESLSNMPAGHHHPSRLVAVNPPLELVPPVHPENGPVVLQHPGLRRNVQSVRLGGASRSRAGTGERDTHLPRNISEHPMFMPSSAEVRSNVAHNPLSFNLNGGGHVGSSSQAGAGPTSAPSWGSSRRHPSSQYSRRLSEYVRRSLLSEGGSHSAHRPPPPSTQEVGLPSGGGSHAHNQPFSRSVQWMNSHGDGGIGIPYSLRDLSAAGEGRSRLVSEQIRNVLDMMRRGEGLRFEDVMVLDPSVIFGMADIHDQHRDMRLDVDNMSYEELLALEERIGSVSTGITAETVTARMKRRKYLAITRDDQADVEPCCICQEEYNEGEDLGTLDCGHDFHTKCIKQWLGQKNMCPICKTTGLAT